MTMDEVFIGVVDHFYPNINVAVIELIERLTAGDSLHFISPETRSVKIDFMQKVVSMEIEHQQIEAAEPGQIIAIRVDQRVRKKDRVYKQV
jgi:translation initiation factor 2 gamma subunit (eIF-2gamma)